MPDFSDQLRNNRHNFEKGKLGDHFDVDPFVFFKNWYQEALEKKVIEANAFTLATVDSNSRPSNRVLFLREIDEKGFTFYTNYTSKKGLDLDKNPFGSMLFFWPDMERQIRIQGRVQKVDTAISDAYFASRPRSSQLGAWASQQSQILASRLDLENRLIELEKKYPANVPRPPHWGGYQLLADQFEFWQGRTSRLHDRIQFSAKKGGEWEIHRLNP